MKASNNTTNNTTDDDNCESYEPQCNDVLKSPDDKKEYVVEEILGSGTYGTVVKCLEMGTRDTVAVKMAQQEGRDNAMIEADLLTKIRKSEGGNEYLIRMLGAVFVHNTHIVCLTLELMEMSLHYYVHEATEDRHLDLAEIRRVLHDVLMGLVRLKELRIIHADLKPGNVMLMNSGHVRTLRAKIIDFGLAHLASRQHASPMVQTQPYRSPEVVMHCLPYSEAVDVWSVGCIMGELLTKNRLYPGQCEYDHLRYIVEHQGFPSLKMIKQGLRSSMYFTKATGRAPFRLKTPKEFLAAVSNDDYEDITEDLVVYDERGTVAPMAIICESMPMYLYGDDMQAELSDRRQAFNLFEVLLKLDPLQRISANKAVQHPFIQMKHLRPFIRSSERVRDCFEYMNIPVDAKMRRSDSRCIGKKKLRKRNRGS